MDLEDDVLREEILYVTYFLKSPIFQGGMGELMTNCQRLSLLGSQMSLNVRLPMMNILLYPRMDNIHELLDICSNSVLINSLLVD